MRLTADDHLAAAVEQFDRFGPPDRTLGFTVGTIASAAGVTRSTVYRRWATIGEANDDLVRHATTHRPGWQRAVLDQPAEATLADALDRAVSAPTLDVGVAVRATITAWPDGPARRDAIAWERSWLTAFASWIEHHVTATGRRFGPGLSARDGAVALAALVDGLLLLELRSSVGRTGWDRGRRAMLSRGATVLLEQLTEPETAPRPPRSARPGPAGTVAPPPLPLAHRLSTAECRVAIADAVWEGAATAPEAAPGARHQRGAVRLVDVGRLARHLGVSERRLRTIWPTGSDLDADVVEAVLRRARCQSDQRVAQMLAVGTRRRYAAYDRLLASTVQALVAPRPTSTSIAHLGCTPSFDDPVVRTRVGAVTEGWRTADHQHFLATLAMAGRYRRTDIEVPDCTRLLLGMVTGLQRLAVAHPELSVRRVAAGHDQPLLGLLGTRLLLGLSGPQRPDRPGEPLEAPGIGRWARSSRMRTGAS